MAARGIWMGIGRRSVPGARAVGTDAFAQSGRHGVFRIGPLTDDPRVPCTTRGPARPARVETEWSRMTVETLKDCNKKILARMAKDQGIAGWHAMRKDQLIRALMPSSLTASKKDARDGVPKVAPP